VLAVGTAAGAESRWTLWERAVDVNGQNRGEWRRTQVYEGERWCKGAMTTAINRTLRARWKGGRWDPKAKVVEYQCLPETEKPRE
jgi:hypothetical protein